VDTNLAPVAAQDLTPALAAEKRDLLARLLARLAHEIRNPLSSLDIHVQLLEEDLGTLAPQIRDQLTTRLEIIQGELHRLDGIVAQFLRLAGPSALDLDAVDVAAIVRHVLALLRPEAESRQIRLTAPTSSGIPPFLADSVRLTQALLNLVINAIQAVDRAGAVEIVVSRSGDEVSLEVRDSGPGIPEDKLASIFDPYYTTKTEGHGLGLWIVQQIVAAHGGTVRAANRAGGGAMLTITLPYKEAASSTSAADSAPEGVVQPSAS
jgi:signal transduction histidine kinase